MIRVTGVITGPRNLLTIDIINRTPGVFKSAQAVATYEYSTTWVGMDGIDYEHSGTVEHERVKDVVYLLAEVLADINRGAQGGEA